VPPPRELEQACPPRRPGGEPPVPSGLSVRPIRRDGPGHGQWIAKWITNRRIRRRPRCRPGLTGARAAAGTQAVEVSGVDAVSPGARQHRRPGALSCRTHVQPAGRDVRVPVARRGWSASTRLRQARRADGVTRLTFDRAERLNAFTGRDYRDLRVAARRCCRRVPGGATPCGRCSRASGSTRMTHWRWVSLGAWPPTRSCPGGPKKRRPPSPRSTPTAVAATKRLLIAGPGRHGASSDGPRAHGVGHARRPYDRRGRRIPRLATAFLGVVVVGVGRAERCSAGTS